MFIKNCRYVTLFSQSKNCFWLLLRKSKILNTFRTKSNFRYVNFSNKIPADAQNLKISNLLLEHQLNLLYHFNELLTEAGVNYPEKYFLYSHKNALTHLKINVLKGLKLLNKDTNVLQNLINQITDFPTSLAEELLNNYSHNQELTIVQSRALVEQKYLAWKFNMPEIHIRKILQYYNIYFFQGRSLMSLQRNLNQLKRIKNTLGWSVPNKILFINLIPCDEYIIEKCNEFPDILMWHNKSCRKLLWPHKVLTFLCYILKKEGFTDDQIEVAINLRVVDIFNYFEKLKIILYSDKLFQFRNDITLFYLLTLPLEILKSESEIDTLYLKYVEDFESRNKIERSKEIKKGRNTAVWKLVVGSLNLSTDHIRFLGTHPNWLRCTDSELKETFLYLTENFSKTEIVESLPILLYPRSMIENELQRVNQKKEDLSLVGFEKGYISTKNLFSCGSRVQDKRLSLCLYYLDKNFGVPESNKF